MEAIGLPPSEQLCFLLADVIYLSIPSSKSGNLKLGQFCSPIWNCLKTCFIVKSMKGCMRHLLGGGGQGRDPVKHSTMYRPAPHNKKLSGPKHQRHQVEKHYAKLAVPKITVPRVDLQVCYVTFQILDGNTQTSVEHCVNH